MATVTEQEIKISKRIIRQAVDDAVKSASAVKLAYVNDKKPGITRVRNGNGFYYLDNDKKLDDKEQLERVKKLVIPPAWEDVWICKLPNGHLQATGLDKNKRKQYIYHPLWSVIRSQTKFYHMIEFGKQLPSIRLQLEKDLKLPGFPQEKVLAAIVSLLERTSIRIGNTFYEKLYGSFGLTTMKNRHVAINGSKINFSFTGKKGVKHHITLNSRKLSSIVKACKDIPGKELFEYYDDNQNIHNIDSGMVNEYIRNISGGDFTAKDFRTWAGSIQALLALKQTGAYENATEMKKNISAAFDVVAKQLGNTRTVCKKYYVHPIIPALYESNKLEKYINESYTENEKDTLTADEKIFMKILEEN